jgi:hypothetical protein
VTRGDRYLTVNLRVLGVDVAEFATLVVVSLRRVVVVVLIVTFRCRFPSTWFVSASRRFDSPDRILRIVASTRSLNVTRMWREFLPA